MNYLDKFRQIITEGYNFTNPNEVIEAIKTNQAGVKIDPTYKQLNGNTEGNVRLNFLKYFKKCTELGVKDITYGVQILLSKTNDINLEQTVRSDGLYEFLKSYKKPWVKELQEYKELMSDFTTNNLRRFEKAVQAEQVNHGKAKKGGGLIQDVKEVYNDGTWKLLIPSSFEGAKAASFYIKNGKETPTEWCTRADKNYYNSYSKDFPLYIIRNMKTGKSYQMAFVKETSWNEADIKVHFLDQNDVKGDEITQGDLTAIPDNLLSNIKIPEINGQSARTMKDYKSAKGIDGNEGRKGYINTKEKKLSWGKEQIIDKKYQREAIKFLRSKGDEIPVNFPEMDITKVVSKNGYLYSGGNNSLETYVNKNIKELNDYKKKAGLVRYYKSGHPDEYVEYIGWNLPSGKKSFMVNDSTAKGTLRKFLQCVGELESGSVLKKYENDEYDILSKKTIKRTEKLENIEAKMKKIIARVNKECAADLKSIGYVSFSTLEEKQPKRLSFEHNRFYGYEGMPGRNITFKKNKDDRFFSQEDTYVIDKNYAFSEKNVQWLPDTAAEYEFERMTKQNYDSPAKRKVAWKIMQLVNKYWRKEFQNEIIQNRVEGNYKTNMYEEINYFNY